MIEHYSQYYESITPIPRVNHMPKSGARSTPSTSYVSNRSPETAYLVCPPGTGQDSIVAGIYPAEKITPEQQQWLYEIFGYSGTAPEDRNACGIRFCCCSDVLILAPCQRRIPPDCSLQVFTCYSSLWLGVIAPICSRYTCNTRPTRSRLSGLTFSKVSSVVCQYG